MYVLNVKMRDTSHFVRTCTHLAQVILIKWGMSTILLAFLAQKWEYNSFFAPKNDRTVSIYIASKRIMLQTKILSSRERSFLLVIRNQKHKPIFCWSRKTSVFCEGDNGNMLIPSNRATKETGNHHENFR